MQHVAKTTQFQFHNTAIALGKFEALHKGHQLLLNELKKYQQKGCTGVVFTFDVPPKKVLKGQVEKVIYTKEERIKILEKMNLDVLIEYPFTKEFASQTPEEFIANILVKKLDVKVIIVGEDFHFGRNRSGNIEALQQFSEKYGYELKVIKKLQMGGKDISSTRVRHYTERGEMRKINEMLGSPFSVYGPVVHGQQLGKKVLGMPTANQIPNEEKLLPPKGVYVARIICRGKTYYGISNIGVKPTIDDNFQPGLETYIFDFDDDIYGEEIEVQLLYFKRPEKKFASLEELAKQMKKDELYGREYAKKHFQEEM